MLSNIFLNHQEYMKKNATTLQTDRRIATDRQLYTGGLVLW